jgi:hypothetical protein
MGEVTVDEVVKPPPVLEKELNYQNGRWCFVPDNPLASEASGDVVHQVAVLVTEVGDDRVAQAGDVRARAGLVLDRRAGRRLRTVQVRRRGSRLEEQVPGRGRRVARAGQVVDRGRGLGLRPAGDEEDRVAVAGRECDQVRQGVVDVSPVRAACSPPDTGRRAPRPRADRSLRAGWRGLPTPGSPRITSTPLRPASAASSNPLSAARSGRRPSSITGTSRGTAPHGQRHPVHATGRLRAAPAPAAPPSGLARPVDAARATGARGTRTLATASAGQAVPVGDGGGFGAAGGAEFS